MRLTSPWRVRGRRAYLSPQKAAASIGANPREYHAVELDIWDRVGKTVVVREYQHVDVDAARSQWQIVCDLTEYLWCLISYVRKHSHEDECSRLLTSLGDYTIDLYRLGRTPQSMSRRAARQDLWDRLTQPDGILTTVNRFTGLTSTVQEQTRNNILDTIRPKIPDARREAANMQKQARLEQARVERQARREAATLEKRTLVEQARAERQTVRDARAKKREDQRARVGAEQVAAEFESMSDRPLRSRVRSRARPRVLVESQWANSPHLLDREAAVLVVILEARRVHVQRVSEVLGWWSRYGTRDYRPITDVAGLVRQPEAASQLRTITRDGRQGSRARKPKNVSTEDEAVAVLRREYQIVTDLDEAVYCRVAWLRADVDLSQMLALVDATHRQELSRAQFLVGSPRRLAHRQGLAERLAVDGRLVVGGWLDGVQDADSMLGMLVEQMPALVANTAMAEADGLTRRRTRRYRLSGAVWPSEQSSGKANDLRDEGRSKVSGRLVACPLGRTQVTGEVLRVWEETDPPQTWMVVVDQRGFRVGGTVAGNVDAQVGATVTFAATLNPSDPDDPTYGRYTFPKHMYVIAQPGEFNRIGARRRELYGPPDPRLRKAAQESLARVQPSDVVVTDELRANLQLQYAKLRGQWTEAGTLIAAKSVTPRCPTGVVTVSGVATQIDVEKLRVIRGALKPVGAVTVVDDRGWAVIGAPPRGTQVTEGDRVEFQAILTPAAKDSSIGTFSIPSWWRINHTDAWATAVRDVAHDDPPRSMIGEEILL